MSIEDGDPFDPFKDKVPYNTPISRLTEIQNRARWILKGRTTEQLVEASKTIDWLTDEYFYIERERWITRQLENGGSILRFLDYEDRTESGLRYLIESSFNTEITSEFYFQNPENTSELDALVGSLCGFDLDDKAFPEAKQYEYVAVLALRQIADAMNSFSYINWPPALKDDAPTIQLSGLAKFALDAMETVCHAESLKLALQADQHANQTFLDKMNRVIPMEAEALAKKKVSLAASKAASARHKATSIRKTRLLAEWDATSSEYESRADFARIVSQREGMLYRTLYDWIATHDRTKA